MTEFLDPCLQLIDLLDQRCKHADKYEPEPGPNMKSDLKRKNRPEEARKLG